MTERQLKEAQKLLVGGKILSIDWKQQYIRVPTKSFEGTDQFGNWFYFTMGRDGCEMMDRSAKEYLGNTPEEALKAMIAATCDPELLDDDFKAMLSSGGKGEAV
jgi:hypothetical protein